MDTVKSFTVVDEAAIHVLVVFNLFLTADVHDLVTCSVVFPEACLTPSEFLLIVAQHYLVYSDQHYLAGRWNKCNSSIVLAVHFVPFLVDRHIDGSSKFCRPLSFSNDLIAQVCQLCHHLTVIIDGLDELDVEIVRTGCFIVVDMSDSLFLTSAGRTAGTGSTTILGIATHSAWIV